MNGSGMSTFIGHILKLYLEFENFLKLYFNQFAKVLPKVITITLKE
jgi:hypothetical protein